MYGVGEKVSYVVPFLQMIFSKALCLISRINSEKLDTCVQTELLGLVSLTGKFQSPLLLPVLVAE